MHVHLCEVVESLAGCLRVVLKVWAARVEQVLSRLQSNGAFVQDYSVMHIGKNVLIPIQFVKFLI